MEDIAFLALAQAHQHLHWLPAALRLAREPGVRVTVLGSSEAGLAFIRSYDPGGKLTLKRLWAPSFTKDGLFTPPKRWLTLLLNLATILRFPTIVTSEATSSMLKRLPRFRSRLIYMLHGAGDREGGYNPKLGRFDLILASGSKDKQRLISRGIGTEKHIQVTGYAKFELAGQATPIIANDQPLALYNPHSDKQLSSWFDHGQDIVDSMAAIDGWNFVVAPHVKLKRGPAVRSDAPNVRIDRGSVRSIDMSYTDAANVYIGDVSSQVYEYIRRPRPCIFLNLNRIDWRGNENYAHWQLGQVIENVSELGPALNRAVTIQPQFDEIQRQMSERSIACSPLPASERQARAILDLVRGSTA